MFQTKSTKEKEDESLLCCSGLDWASATRGGQRICNRTLFHISRTSLHSSFTRAHSSTVFLFSNIFFFAFMARSTGSRPSKDSFSFDRRHPVTWRRHVNHNATISWQCRINCSDDPFLERVDICSFVTRAGCRRLVGRTVGFRLRVPNKDLSIVIIGQRQLDHNHWIKNSSRKNATYFGTQIRFRFDIGRRDVEFLQKPVLFVTRNVRHVHVRFLTQ